MNFIFFFFLFIFNIFSIEHDTTTKAIWLENLKTNYVVLQKNKEKILPIASLTKLFTALTIYHKIPEKKLIEITKGSIVNNSYESKAGLRIGEEYYFKDLLSSMLIASANDSARAIAIFYSGSTENFTTEMNLYAKENDLLHSSFEEPIGLSSKSQSSVIDIAKVLKKIDEIENIKKILFKDSFILKSKNGREIKLPSRHKLFQVNDYLIMGKTGTTKKAGECFAGFIQKKNKEYILVVLGSSNIAEDLIHSVMELEDN